MTAMGLMQRGAALNLRLEEFLSLLDIDGPVCQRLIDSNPIYF